jgi:hypothetical protein
MLSISIAGETTPPVLYESTKGGARFLIQDTFGKWTPFHLPNDSGEALLRGIKNMQTELSSRKHEAGMRHKAVESVFAFDVSSRWVKVRTEKELGAIGGEEEGGTILRRREGLRRLTSFHEHRRWDAGRP